MQLANNKPALTVWTTIPMSHNNISLQIYISNPDYDQSCGRFWEKQKHKKQKQNWGQCSSLFATLQYEATRHTQQKKKKLWCSHKVNVKLHSAAALQQWAFKLIWLAVKPHAGARARGHTHTYTHRHTRARTRTHGRAGTQNTHTRWIKHWARSK